MGTPTRSVPPQLRRARRPVKSTASTTSHYKAKSNRGGLWAETPALDLYFEEKEFSPRDDRRGFPPLIKEELLAMHVYSLRNRPARYEEQALLHALYKAAILG